ncbi:uncharacterized protein F5147DRAFT_714482 [Suillus discolor]|uniref:Uncharacterized protein n=1 Tax=Suillus discolor TaxID=1912936 RepID=A0A9P7EZL1_9AGAM|nr:uncharacterized protein F5147DRAFT_714482 [Suillus discolor]KAG2097935.1 hypothetical protein F5147DRAFT_714482 [Suillus discolor]
MSLSPNGAYPCPMLGLPRSHDSVSPASYASHPTSSFDDSSSGHPASSVSSGNVHMRAWAMLQLLRFRLSPLGRRQWSQPHSNSSTVSRYVSAQLCLSRRQRQRLRQVLHGLQSYRSRPLLVLQQIEGLVLQSDQGHQHPRAVRVGVGTVMMMMMW